MNTFIIPIVVSVKMNDFLLVTLERNRKMFEHYFVITEPNDTKTIELCKKFNVQLIFFNNFYINNSKFNKSGAIQHAQLLLHKQFPEKWILLLDSDILLPLNFDYYNSQDQIIKFNKYALYSTNRFDVLDSIKLKNNILKKYKGATHDGYFQMYFDKTKYYPGFSQNAAFCDLIFRDLFEIKKLLLFPVLHIGEPGLHWDGRNCESWK